MTILKDPLMLVATVTRKTSIFAHGSMPVTLCVEKNFVLKDCFATVIMGCSLQCDPAVLLSQLWLKLSLNIVDSEVNQGLRKSRSEIDLQSSLA